MRKIRRSNRERISERVKDARRRSIYLLPNSFTLASLFCAFYGVIQAVGHNYAVAATAIFISMLFDGMDGRVARLTHTQSEFGVQFDSIADMTAFGAAPAIIAYCYSLETLGAFGWAAAFIFCAGAGIRLARFNTFVGVIDKGFFQGLASPAGAALVMGFIWLCESNQVPLSLYENRSMITAALCIYAGVTMISNAPFFSGKNMGFVRTIPFWAVLVGSILIICLSSWPWFSAFALFCAYALSGYIYQIYLAIRGLPNPVIPKKADEVN